MCTNPLPYIPSSNIRHCPYSLSWATMGRNIYPNLPTSVILYVYCTVYSTQHCITNTVVHEILNRRVFFILLLFIWRVSVWWYSQNVWYTICMLVLINIKEVIKEQPTPTNLSATARRVLQCTRSQKPSCSFKERFFGFSHRTVPETPSQIVWWIGGFFTTPLHR